MVWKLLKLVESIFSDEFNMNFYNEMNDVNGGVCVYYQGYDGWFKVMLDECIVCKWVEVDLVFYCVGIMFVVYGEEVGKECLILFDIILCIILFVEWKLMQEGLCQWVKVLNMFLYDIYYDQEIFKVGKILVEQVFNNV